MLEINNKVPPNSFIGRANKSETVTYSKGLIHICLINQYMNLDWFTFCLFKKINTKLVVNHLITIHHDIYQVFLLKNKDCMQSYKPQIYYFFNLSRIFFHKNKKFPNYNCSFIGVVFSVIRQFIIMLLISVVIFNLGCT